MHFSGFRTFLTILGVKLSIATGLSSGFKKYGASLFSPRIEPCKYLPDDSDEFWECFVRHLGTAIYHETGTCKMGPPDDTEAVVDSQLR